MVVFRWSYHFLSVYTKKKYKRIALLNIMHIKKMKLNLLTALFTTQQKYFPCKANTAKIIYFFW
jgi:hypothetical protein